MLVLASTAYDIGRAIGYLLIPVVIGAVILFIARSQGELESQPARGRRTAGLVRRPVPPGAPALLGRRALDRAHGGLARTWRCEHRARAMSLLTPRGRQAD